MTEAVIYLRVSTVDQAKRNREPEGYSIPAQREACQRQARMLEADVTAEFVDRGASARSASRPELKNLLAFIVGHSVKYVIVHKIDRLARNLADHVEITLAIKAAGAELVSVSENVDHTPLGEYMQTIFAANAQLYSANLATEARKGLHAKAKQGGTPGLAPLGYLNVRKMIEGFEVRTVEVDPERAPHVQWAFAAYASGAYTLDTLHAALERRGFKTRPTRMKPAKSLSRAQLANLLASKYYVGLVTYGGVEYPGRHKPLIDADTFARVQAVLSAHTNSGEKDRKHHHYLKGSLVCARCGHKMTYLRAKGNGGTYTYFACVGRLTGGSCQQRYVSVDAAEEKVAAHWQAISLTPKQLAESRRHLQTAVAGMQQQSQREVRRQRGRIEKLRAEREKLLQAFYADAIALDHLKKEQDRIALDTAMAEQHLATAQASLGEVQEVLDQALDLVEHCGNAYRQAGPQTRRQWNQAFFTKLLVHDDEIRDDERAAPFDDLLDPKFPARVERGRAAPSKGHFDRPGSNKRLLVGTTGFEPATFRPPAGANSPAMLIQASAPSSSSPCERTLDVLDSPVGTKPVPRAQR